MSARKGIADALKNARKGVDEESPAEESSELVSLKKTKAQKKSSAPQLASGPSGEDYSYGTRLSLGKDELEKLGIKDMPKVGTKFKLEAEVEVVSVSANAGKDHDSRDMGLQITAMCLE